MVSSPAWNVSATGYTSRLAEYKETVSRLYPILPKDCVDVWSISEADVLALGLLLDCYPQKVTVLDIGSFVGASAFFFASHSKVTRVVSVDPNPRLAEEINDKSEMLGVKIDPEPLGKLRVLDVARTVLAEFPDENRKIQLHVGTVGTGKTGRTAGCSARSALRSGGGHAAFGSGHASRAVVVHTGQRVGESSWSERDRGCRCAREEHRRQVRQFRVHGSWLPRPRKA